MKMNSGQEVFYNPSISQSQLLILTLNAAFRITFDFLAFKLFVSRLNPSILIIKRLRPGLRGLCFKDKILISDRLSGIERYKTAVHELLHLFDLHANGVFTFPEEYVRLLSLELANSYFNQDDYIYV